MINAELNMAIAEDLGCNWFVKDGVRYLRMPGHPTDIPASKIDRSIPLAPDWDKEVPNYAGSFNAIHNAAWSRFKTPQDADVFANALKIIAAVAKKRSWQLGAKEWAQAYVDAIAILKRQQAKRV